MHMLSKRTVRVAALAALTLLTVLVVASTVSAASKATNVVTIWTDADRKAAVDRIASAWGTARGVNVVVVQKDFGKIRDDLGTVQADSAPDVIVGAHDWTGALAANGLVVPITPRTAIRDQFPAYTLDCVLVRHRREAALRRSRGRREHRPRRQHRARQGAEDLRGARVRRARLQEEEERQPRHRRPAGRGR